MPELHTANTLEDDIALLKRFDTEAVSQHHRRHLSLQLGIMGVGLFCAASWLHDALVKGLCIVAGGCSIAAVGALQRGLLAKKSLPPPDVLERVAASGDISAAELILPLYERYQHQDSKNYSRILAQYLSALNTLEISINYKPLTEILIGILYRTQYSAPALAVAIIETFVRCRATEVLTKLLLLSEGFASTSMIQTTRNAAREAVIQLSEHADFGATHEIPAKVKELYRLRFFSDNGSSIRSERQVWLTHALTYLLPNVTKADAHLFDKKYRSYLYSLAAGSNTNYTNIGRKDSELRQAILLALGAIEDIDAIPTLISLAHCDAPTDHEQATRALAKKQLAILTALKEKREIGSTLLRASDSPVTAQDQLLRPVAATEETQQETLLRPSQS